MGDVVEERERERDEAMIAEAAAMSPEQSKKELKKILDKVEWKKGAGKQWTEEAVRKLVDEKPHNVKVNRPKTVNGSGRLKSTVDTSSSKLNSSNSRKEIVTSNATRPRTAG